MRISSTIDRQVNFFDKHSLSPLLEVEDWTMLYVLAFRRVYERPKRTIYCARSVAELCCAPARPIPRGYGRDHALIGKVGDLRRSSFFQDLESTEIILQQIFDCPLAFQNQYPVWCLPEHRSRRDPLCEDGHEQESMQSRRCDRDGFSNDHVSSRSLSLEQRP